MVLLSNMRLEQTVVSNGFIDRYMADANGEFVKVYLYLLRLLEDRNMEFSVNFLADRLNHTEKDVMRALAYWEKLSLLRMEYEEGQLQSVAVLDVPSTLEAAQEMAAAGIGRAEAVKSKLPARKASGKASALVHLQEDEEFRQLLFVAEAYLGRTLAPKDMELFAYLYEDLNFPVDLIEYLIEYCVDGGHKSSKYIEAVALGWHTEGKTTVQQVKEASRAYAKENKQIMKAFGIANRILGTEEQRLVNRWLHEYKLPLDLVLEACNRTMASIQKPSFEYADKILKAWHDAGIGTVEEARQYSETKKREKGQQPKPGAKPAAPNRFHNFDQRDTDYEALLREERMSHGADKSTV